MTTVRIAAAILLAFFAGCAAAPDETWFRIAEIRSGGGSAPVAVIDVDLNDGTADTVDLVVQNTTSIAGSSSSAGVGVTVFVARIEYRAAGRDLPPVELPISFFLPAPGSETSSTSTLEGLPIATAAFKDWVLDPANFPSPLLAGLPFIEARIILRARTDEGRHLESEASVNLALR